MSQLSGVASRFPSPAFAERPPVSRVPAWAEALAHLLDSAFVIPGTRIRVGLDALLGLLAPGAGDAVGALATLALFYLGFKLRVPKVILLRMLLNIAVDALVGIVPILGDLFDVYFRAAERNLSLLRKYGSSVPTAPDAGDYAIVGLALFTALCLLALPVLVGFVLLHVVLRVSGN